MSREETNDKKDLKDKWEKVFSLMESISPTITAYHAGGGDSCSYYACMCTQYHVCSEGM